MRYLRSSIDVSLVYHYSKSTNNVASYVDFDFAGDLDKQ